MKFFRRLIPKTRKPNGAEDCDLIKSVIIILYMPGRRPLVVFGLIGSVLDAGHGAARWERWRPTVALCQHEDLLIDRFELLHETKHKSLAERTASDIATVSPETDLQLHEISLGNPWDFQSVYEMLHDFVRTYSFDPEHEDYLVHITTGTHVVQICLFLLTESHYLPGKLVQTAPPPRRGRQATQIEGSYRIIDLDLSKYDRLAARFAVEQREGLAFLKAGIDTRNADFNRLMERLEQVAINAVDPILLTGPTGAGKSALARRIYELKKQRRQVEGKLVEVNCATLRGDSAMSTLFGHKKGAFTGAVQDRKGLLREAYGGLLFLDEVAELGLDEQAMLLHALEEKRFLPVGCDSEAESNFQLICGTNRDLAKRVQEGTFREDLLARINLWPFRLPGLSDRREDIEPNVDYELERFAQRTGRAARFNKEARKRFLDFATHPDTAWGANFRDLSAAITRLATLTAGGRITVQLVEEEIARLRIGWTAADPPDADQALLNRVVGAERLADIDPFDRPQLAEAVRICRSSRTLSEAGRRLFAVSRARRKSTNDADRLRKYLAKFDLTWDLVLEAAEY